jgi:hypothetical protein
MVSVLSAVLCSQISLPEIPYGALFGFDGGAAAHDVASGSLHTVP